MKICTKCKVEKDLNEFYKQSKNRDSLAYKCKACVKDYNKCNEDRIKSVAKEYYSNNTTKIKKYSKQYLQNNINTKYKRTASKAKTMAKKVNAVPKWLDKDHIDEIYNVYKTCQIMNDSSEISYHVDHIIPLRSDKVCGLHVSWNLQIINAKSNLSKSNKFISNPSI